MGYAFAHGDCVICHLPFSFNPVRVPSTRAFSTHGEKEPICETCIGLINAKKVELGYEPFDVDPEAYQPCDERELP